MLMIVSKLHGYLLGKNSSNKFEMAFSKFTKIKHSVSVCNGTVAIHLALLALGIKKGDQVIVPSFTYL